MEVHKHLHFAVENRYCDMNKYCETFCQNESWFYFLNLLTYFLYFCKA